MLKMDESFDDDLQGRCFGNAAYAHTSNRTLTITIYPFIFQNVFAFIKATLFSTLVQITNRLHSE